MKKLTFIALLSLASCALVPDDDTGSGGSDKPCVDENMEIPNGYVIDYKITQNGEVVNEVTGFFCYFDKAQNGSWIDYCGFPAEVLEDKYRFDGVSSWNGDTIIGFGDETGAKFTITNDKFTTVFETTHVEAF